jgi:hypothetical protein
LSACGPEQERGPEATWDIEQEVDVCKGTNTLPSGGKFESKNDWNDMGVADQPGYTGIDTNSDMGLINAEKRATEAMKGGGCIYGAHGYDPVKCGGKSTVQSLPHDTSQSVFHNEYHTECMGQPMWLSVCFSGKKPTAAGYVSIAAGISENYNVPADKIVACTGLVGPGNPMKCFGTLVDGTGKPIGEQQVGDLKFIEVRGEPAEGELIRCSSNDSCPTCTPDAGTDGGCTGTSCSTDAGTTSDAGNPTYDAGSPTYDAGSPTYDAGSPTYDAGSPTYDAGSPTYDAGSPTYDAGSPTYDAGSPTYDAGSPTYDAGSPTYDAGVIYMKTGTR